MYQEFLNELAEFLQNSGVSLPQQVTTYLEPHTAAKHLRAFRSEIDYTHPHYHLTRDKKISSGIYILLSMIPLLLIIYESQKDEPGVNLLVRVFFGLLGLFQIALLSFDAYQSIPKLSDNAVSFALQKGKYSENQLEQTFNEPISSSLAIEYLIHFLEGQIVGKNLKKLIAYFKASLEKESGDDNKILYQGILKVLLSADALWLNKALMIEGLHPISQYVESNQSTSTSKLIANQHYRNLLVRAYHYYWQTSITHDDLKRFNQEDPSLSQLLLLSLIPKKQRDLIFTINDSLKEAWSIIVVNQSKQDSKQTLASEAEAFERLKQVIQLATQNALMSKALVFYTLNHALKGLCSLQHDHRGLSNIVTHVQDRISDQIPLLPFLKLVSPNLQLVQSLVLEEAHEQEQVDNSVASLNFNTPQKPTSAKELYRIYEAILFRGDMDKQQIEQVRLNLMTALLKENNWDWKDVRRNCAPHSIGMASQGHGWWDPSKALPLPDYTPHFCSVSGLLLNYSTYSSGSRVQVVFQKAGPSTPSHQHLLTLYDFIELWQHDVNELIFSLDPPNPRMLFHPFNFMRVVPEVLLVIPGGIHTFFIADYLLKLFTVFQEVQCEYPFATRPLESMIAHLPAHLRKIIYDYQVHQRNAQRTNKNARFWIDVVDVHCSDTGIKSNHFREIAIGEPTIVVCQHELMHDEYGKLVDTPDQQEGWNIYRVDENCIIKPPGCMKKPAILFKPDSVHVYCDNEIQTFVLDKEKHKNLLDSLTKQAVGDGDFVKPTKKNACLLYQLTKIVTQLTDKPLHYSPEAIFVNEFTAHFNEFSIYFPVFARLRELSKLIFLIKLMSIVHQQNKEVEEKLGNDHRHSLSEEILLRSLSHDLRYENFTRKKNQAPPDISKRCRWVPANTRNDGKLLVYGGVNVNPQLLFSKSDSDDGKHLLAKMRRRDLFHCTTRKAFQLSLATQRYMHANPISGESYLNPTLYLLSKQQQFEQQMLANRHRILNDAAKTLLFFSPPASDKPSLVHGVVNFVKRKNPPPAASSSGGGGNGKEPPDPPGRWSIALFKAILITMRFPITPFDLHELHNATGSFIYVVTEDNELRVCRVTTDGSPANEDGSNMVCHTELSEGKLVRAAGTFVIKNGIIDSITNLSGHYQPFGPSAKQAMIEAFKKIGMDVRQKYIELRFDDVPHEFDEPYGTRQLEFIHNYLTMFFEYPNPDKLPQHYARILPKHIRDQKYSGRLAYVVTRYGPEGDLVIDNPNNNNQCTHNDLAWGEPVRAAGYVTFENGELVKIDNDSEYRAFGRRSEYAAYLAFHTAGFNVYGKYREIIHKPPRNNHLRPIPNSQSNLLNRCCVQ